MNEFAWFEAEQKNKFGKQREKERKLKLKTKVIVSNGYISSLINI